MYQFFITQSADTATDWSFSISSSESLSISFRFLMSSGGGLHLVVSAVFSRSLDIVRPRELLKSLIPYSLYSVDLKGLMTSLMFLVKHKKHLLIFKSHGCCFNSYISSNSAN